MGCTDLPQMKVFAYCPSAPAFDDFTCLPVVYRWIGAGHVPDWLAVFDYVLLLVGTETVFLHYKLHYFS